MGCSKSEIFREWPDKVVGLVVDVEIRDNEVGRCRKVEMVHVKGSRQSASCKMQLVRANACWSREISEYTTTNGWVNK